MDNFLAKKFYNSLKIASNYFLQHFKNKIIFNFVKFAATKNGMIKKMFHPSHLLLFLDPGSEIRDPGWVKIRIRNTEIFGHKNPGSALDQDPFWIRIQVFSLKCWIRIPIK